MENWELTVFDFNTIVNATNNFSKYFKVAEGDTYGHIYMGTLEEGTEIALKIFSKISKQAQEEFQSEGRCLAKLQHQNIVKLLGYCPQGKGRMLIFECMPNKSLNSYIFDGERKSSLDWPKRYNIIIGIARGLLYLHQDSHVRIIHRDLKTSSILLDKDMNPKISDFGLARIMEGSLTKAHTTRKLGTFGYMAPEYTIDGIYSTKSDVFSFGVVVLEIVSGKKNRGYHSNHDPNLLGQAWSLYKNKKQLELIDDTIKDSYEESQVNRAIVIGLLCVQKFPEDRPDMPEVLLMLGGDIPLREPKQPGYGIYETN